MHSFPPFHYLPENCLTNRKGTLRPPSESEREVIAGCPGWIHPCSSEESGQTASGDFCVTVDCGFLCCMWSLPVVAWFLRNLLLPRSLCPDMTLQHLVERFRPGALNTLGGFLFRPFSLRMPPSPCKDNLAARDLAAHLGTLASCRGDVLLVKGESVPNTAYPVFASAGAGETLGMGSRSAVGHGGRNVTTSTLKSSGCSSARSAGACVASVKVIAEPFTCLTIWWCCIACHVVARPVAICNEF